MPAAMHLERMRDAMEHRGPDGKGLWVGRGAMLGHRRLAVIDPGPTGHQPLVSACGRFILAYNGEVYNDDELRDKLDRRPASRCDTATLLAWLSEGRPLDAVRGMYAFALIDTTERTLTLARDPLGIKPMFWTATPGGVAFASEIQALFEHPDVSPRPDPLGVSMYLSSVRTIMGTQTLFEGIVAVEPGQSLVFQLDDATAKPRANTTRIEKHAGEPADDELFDLVQQSIEAHLRTDVELCTLLSGGLDSGIITTLAMRSLGSIRTYCAGASQGTGDPSYAQLLADVLGTDHSTAVIDEPQFCSMWIDTVDRTGLPLATPNETAIRLIARTLRADGQIVTLSGEGADEIFAGYDGPLQAAINRAEPSGGLHELQANAWIAADIKPTLLVGDFARQASEPEALVALFEAAFERAIRLCGSDGPTAHLRFQRIVNLPMLLHRLDSATMLESVEGRTPFADTRVAAAAAAIPLGRLFDPSGETPPTRTKLAPRSAFNHILPAEILRRPKASFPLPFERWMSSIGELARSSDIGASIIQPALLSAIAENPAAHWHLAWPTFNVVLWAERWWGRGLRSPLAAACDQASAASTRGTAPSRRFV